MWTWLMLGIAIGLLLAIPAAWLWSRRTERRVRQLEARANTAERLAEMGTMTGGLAHEIKNPLSTIGLNIQLLAEDMNDLERNAPPGALDTDHLGRINRRFGTVVRESHRLREILEDFLRFAGRVKLDRQTCDIHQLIEELAVFFEPQAAASKVNLRTDLGANPCVLNADASLLKQALLNLVLNATQAMTEARETKTPHGGASELIVRTENTKTAGQPQLVIHVTDTGPGMDNEIRQQVFQPYFTTKRGGSGLGLPTSRRIIEEHRGTITIHSEPGKGTDFIIRLPMTDPSD